MIQFQKFQYLSTQVNYSVSKIPVSINKGAASVWESVLPCFGQATTFKNRLMYAQLQVSPDENPTPWQAREFAGKL
jgi:hypothetical protein